MGNNIVADNGHGARAKVDPRGESVKVEATGLVRIDGIACFKRVERAGKIYLQFCDNDRLRASCRGTRLVEVPLESLFQILEMEKRQ